MNQLIQQFLLLFPKEQLLYFLIQLLQELAKKTDNEIDDALVFAVTKVIKMALCIEDKKAVN